MKSIALYIICVLGFFFNKVSNYILLPTVFENDLIYLSIPLDLDTLYLYTDTGGKNLLYKSGMRKLDIKCSKKNLWEELNIETILVKNEIPIPFLKEIYFTNDKSSKFNGMLGREWFASKNWEFDYEHKTLKYFKLPPEKVKVDANQMVNLYFKKDALGNPMNHLARIQIIVKSDTLSMLFDTGAQAHLSIEAQKELNKRGLVATSFVNASTFDMWRKTYPEWSVIQGGDLSYGQKSDIIIVPEIQIGDKIVGPVEFVKRKDSNFKVMSEFFMDEEITGAIGGNALSGLKKFTVDYNSEELMIIE
ncbi:MAG: hypothetical protein R2792_17335 [Saprospiraceae bacterium]